MTREGLWCVVHNAEMVWTPPLLCRVRRDEGTLQHPEPCRLNTDDQLVAGVSNALAEGDIEAVEAIMLVLAGRNPARAQEVFDTMQLGVRIAKQSGDGDA